MSDEIGPGSLKLVVAAADPAVEVVLRSHVRDADLRSLGRGAWVAYTDAEPATIRDWLAAALSDGEPAFVVEFERWSSHGKPIDPAWLLRRGH
ncbi:MAG: hypothetical protein HY873_14110 [Chloroflexi bacterium]|nr:hypothetical protein [Chloroflexota bacterium]